MRKTQPYANLLRFVERNLVVGLVEVLLDIFILVRYLGPDVYAFLDAEDAFRCGTKVLAEVMVDAARYAYIERARAFLTDAHGLVDAGAEPSEVLCAIV